MKLRLFSLALLACGPAAAQAPSGPPLVDDAMLAYIATKDSVELPDGRMLHFVCLGSGSPTVIMTAGLGGDGSDFRWVHSAIAKTTRACTWDRPGFAFSDGNPNPQTVETTTADLAAALEAGSIPGPYILVGHSLGSYESMLYADRHSDRVAGMVLLDPSFPKQTAVFDALIPGTRKRGEEVANSSVSHLRKCAADLRAGKIEPDGDDPNGCFGYPPFFPPGLRTALNEKLAEPVQMESIASFLENAVDAGELVANPARDYGAMPLVVLTATEQFIPPDASDEVKAQQALQDREWNRQHDLMAAWSSRGVNARVPGADHYIQRSKPQVVIDAVEAVIAEARAASD